MGMAFTYVDDKNRNILDRLKDMKHMIFQQEEYDLSTSIGRDNTWHAVNGMILGSLACILGGVIGDKLSEPIVKKKQEEMKQKAFREGQISAYKSILNKPDLLMTKAFDVMEKDPKKFNLKHF